MQSSWVLTDSRMAHKLHVVYWTLTNRLNDTKFSVFEARIFLFPKYIVFISLWQKVLINVCSNFLRIGRSEKVRIRNAQLIKMYTYMHLSHDLCSSNHRTVFWELRLLSDWRSGVFWNTSSSDYISRPIPPVEIRQSLDWVFLQHTMLIR